VEEEEDASQLNSSRDQRVATQTSKLCICVYKLVQVSGWFH